MLKGLPFAYNRDLQEDKEPLFDSIDTVLLVLPAVTGMVATTDFDREKMAFAAPLGFSLATEIADYLVRAKVPFAQAHDAAGKCVALCEQSGRQLHQLGRHERQEAVAQVTDDVVGERARVAPLLHRVGDDRERTTGIVLDERLDELVERGGEQRLAAARGDQLERRHALAKLAQVVLAAQRHLGGGFSSDGGVFRQRFEILAGAGGTDAQDWAGMLLRMYQRWAELRGWEVDIEDALPGEGAGIFTTNMPARGWLAYEELAALGCTKPVVPGIMPISNLGQVTRMAHMSGAEVPGWVVERVEKALMKELAAWTQAAAAQTAPHPQTWRWARWCCARVARR